MRVLVLTPYPYGTVAGPRSSFELWERVLREAGVELDYAVFETDRLHEIIYRPGQAAAKAAEMLRSYALYLPKVHRSRRYDAVLVNREATLVGPALLERWVARRTPIIYHLDDPLYVPYRSPSNGALSYLKCFGKVRTLCRIASAVIANSSSHVSFARRHNENVWQIPSVVDGELYTGWRSPPGDPQAAVCVGWTGSPTTGPNLHLIEGALERLARRTDVRLRFIGAPDLELPSVPHESLPWRAASEVEDLRALQVGLLPVPLTEWTPHKFYLKLVQYMALGIPAVATPLGDNAEVIDDGRTGFLASTEAEWYDTVDRLVKDPQLRAQVGRAAAEVARKRYTLQANAERIVAAFRSVAERRRRAPGHGRPLSSAAR